MAASDLQNYVDALSKCPICLDDLIEPKSLPCLHTFCLRCIKIHCTDNCPGDDANCPVCRTAFVIPDTGVEQLISNFFIKGLVDAKNISGKSADRMPCDSCLAQSEDEADASVENVTMYCTGCCWKLCDRCSKPHRKIPGGTHVVIPFGTGTTNDLLKSQGRHCILHSDNKLELYCLPCHTNVCITCHVSKHRTHDCIDIASVHEEFRETIRRDVKRISDHEGVVLQAVATLEEQRAELNNTLVRILNEIQQNADEIKTHVDDAVSQLTQKLEFCKADALKSANSTKDPLDFALAAMRSFIRYSSELMKSGKPCDITHAYYDLRSRADDLLKQTISIDDYHPPEVSVTAGDVFDSIAGYVLAKSNVYRMQQTNLESRMAKQAREHADTLKKQAREYEAKLKKEVDMREAKIKQLEIVQTKLESEMAKQAQEHDDTLKTQAREHEATLTKLRNDLALPADNIKHYDLDDKTLTLQSGTAAVVPIVWSQFWMNPTGMKEEYRACIYKSADDRSFTVFVAVKTGYPPVSFSTIGYKSMLHFGLNKVNDNTSPVFFVIHSADWKPYQNRFINRSDRTCGTPAVEGEYLFLIG